MARHLRLALLALAAGCVDLAPPDVVTSDGQIADPWDGASPLDAAREVGGVAHSDGPLLDARDGDAELAAPDRMETPPDGQPPDTQPPDTRDAGDGPAPLLANGGTCSTGLACESGICSEGVCCDQPCTELCRSCKISGFLGSCIATPTGPSPRAECGAEATSTCGRAGGCDGAGACRLHPAATVCVSATCSSGSETPARTCDGRGVCQAASARSCSPYACSGTSCATSCTDASQCASGQVCFLNGCVPTGSAPALYWSFDEASGSTALDLSGNNLHGTYTGVSGSPAPSTDVPPLMFSNPRSRSFNIANRQGVRLASMPSYLKPTNNITLSVWWKATRVDTQAPVHGGELITGADDYTLRLEETGVVLIKHTNGAYPRCDGRRAGLNPLDGQWHHAAGVASSTGMKVYLDGQEGCSFAVPDAIQYIGNSELWVGRHALGDTDRDFDGLVDEVRVYTRALSATEIQNLAAGRR